MQEILEPHRRHNLHRQLTEKRQKLAKKGKNVLNKSTTSNKTSIMSEIRVELHLNDFGKFGNKSISQKELDVRCQLTNPWSEKTLLALSEITAIFFSPDIKRCLSTNFTISSGTFNSQRESYLT